MNPHYELQNTLLLKDFSLRYFRLNVINQAQMQFLLIICRVRIGM